MSEDIESPPENVPVPSQPKGVNEGRRRLGKLGAGGTAAVLSVASRSAVAGWGSCTGSELASGNLSRPGAANPCGCSPGFWWNNNGTALWTSSPTLNVNFTRTKKFNTVFGRAFYNGNNVQLKDVRPNTSNQNAFGANDNTGMHAVAALLNAQYYGERYPVLGMQSAAAVIAAFQAACDKATMTTSANGKKAAFAEFVQKVDIYSRTTDLWCSGSRES
jgi:hypothetical protein